MRGYVNRLPKRVFRVDYEQSATLSIFTSQHTHVRHRLNENLHLETGNAFQSVGKFSLKKDLTLLSLERHLLWCQKKPSSYISSFKNLGEYCAFEYPSSSLLMI
jgi:hypothetical protein